MTTKRHFSILPPLFVSIFSRWMSGLVMSLLLMTIVIVHSWTVFPASKASIRSCGHRIHGPDRQAISLSVGSTENNESFDGEPYDSHFQSEKFTEVPISHLMDVRDDIIEEESDIIEEDEVDEDSIMEIADALLSLRPQSSVTTMKVEEKSDNTGESSARERSNLTNNISEEEREAWISKQNLVVEMRRLKRLQMEKLALTADSHDGSVGVGPSLSSSISSDEEEKENSLAEVIANGLAVSKLSSPTDQVGNEKLRMVKEMEDQNLQTDLYKKKLLDDEHEADISDYNNLDELNFVTFFEGNHGDNEVDAHTSFSFTNDIRGKEILEEAVNGDSLMKNLEAVPVSEPTLPIRESRIDDQLLNKNVSNTIERNRFEIDLIEEKRLADERETWISNQNHIVELRQLERQEKERHANEFELNERNQTDVHSSFSTGNDTESREGEEDDGINEESKMKMKRALPKSNLLASNYASLDESEKDVEKKSQSVSSAKDDYSFAFDIIKDNGKKEEREAWLSEQEPALDLRRTLSLEGNKLSTLIESDDYYTEGDRQNPGFFVKDTEKEFVDNSNERKLVIESIKKGTLLGKGDLEFGFSASLSDFGSMGAEKKGYGMKDIREIKEELLKQPTYSIESSNVSNKLKGSDTKNSEKNYFASAISESQTIDNGLSLKYTTSDLTGSSINKGPKGSEHIVTDKKNFGIGTFKGSVEPVEVLNSNFVGSSTSFVLKGIHDTETSQDSVDTGNLKILSLNGPVSNVGSKSLGDVKGWETSTVEKKNSLVSGAEIMNSDNPPSFKNPIPKQTIYYTKKDTENVGVSKKSVGKGDVKWNTVSPQEVKDLLQKNHIAIPKKSSFSIHLKGSETIDTVKKSYGIGAFKKNASPFEKGFVPKDPTSDLKRQNISIKLKGDEGTSTTKKSFDISTLNKATDTLKDLKAKSSLFDPSISLELKAVKAMDTAKKGFRIESFKLKSVGTSNVEQFMPIDPIVKMIDPNISKGLKGSALSRSFVKSFGIGAMKKKSHILPYSNVEEPMLNDSILNVIDPAVHVESNEFMSTFNKTAGIETVKTKGFTPSDLEEVTPKRPISFRVDMPHNLSQLQLNQPVVQKVSAADDYCNEVTQRYDHGDDSSKFDNISVAESDGSTPAADLTVKEVGTGAPYKPKAFSPPKNRNSYQNDSFSVDNRQLDSVGVYGIKLDRIDSSIIDVKVENFDSMECNEVVGENDKSSDSMRRNLIQERPLNLWTGESFRGTVSSRSYGLGSGRPVNVMNSAPPSISKSLNKGISSVEMNVGEASKIKDINIAANSIIDQERSIEGEKMTQVPAISVEAERKIQMLVEQHQLMEKKLKTQFLEASEIMEEKRRAENKAQSEQMDMLKAQITILEEEIRDISTKSASAIIMKENELKEIVNDIQIKMNQQNARALQLLEEMDESRSLTAKKHIEELMTLKLKIMTDAQLEVSELKALHKKKIDRIISDFDMNTQHTKELEKMNFSLTEQLTLAKSQLSQLQQDFDKIEKAMDNHSKARFTEEAAISEGINVSHQSKERQFQGLHQSNQDNSLVDKGHLEMKYLIESEPLLSSSHTDEIFLNKKSTVKSSKNSSSSKGSEGEHIPGFSSSFLPPPKIHHTVKVSSPQYIPDGLPRKISEAAIMENVSTSSDASISESTNENPLMSDSLDALSADVAALELVSSCEAEYSRKTPALSQESMDSFDQLCTITSNYPFVSILRDSSPYIVNHRHSTIVYHIPGDLISDGAKFNSIMDDIALTWLFGMKIVIAVGCRRQIVQRLQLLHLNSDSDTNRMPGVRVTTPDTLRIVEEEAGFCRFEVERLLNRSLRNKGADCNVVSGCFITAKKFGVVEGVNYQLTGYPTNLQIDKIHRLHSRNDVVLLTPLGFTQDGKALNIHSEALASFTAGALKASKIVYFSSHPMVLHGTGSSSGVERIQMIQRSNAHQILSHYGLHIHSATGFPSWTPHYDIKGNMINRASSLNYHQQSMLLKMGWATHAIEKGVERAHIIDCEDGSLLDELFTARRGYGTCISQDDYEAPHPEDWNDDLSVADGVGASMIEW